MGWAVQVSGIPGSGKSFLRGRLRDAGLREVHDTDAIVAGLVRPADSYAEAVGRAGAWAAKRVRAAEGAVVFVGTAFLLAKAERFHIEVPPAELEAVWRRVLVRELHKFWECRPAAMGAVLRVPAARLPDYLTMKYGLGALSITTSQKEYARMARAARGAARRGGEFVAPQEEVYARLLRLRRPAGRLEIRVAVRRPGRPSPEVEDLARRRAEAERRGRGRLPPALARGGPGTYISAWEGGRLLGVCVLELEGATARVRALCGAAGVKGVGSRLLEEAARWGRGAGARALEAEPGSDDEGFYERRGFRRAKNKALRLGIARLSAAS